MRTCQRLLVLLLVALVACTNGTEDGRPSTPAPTPGTIRDAMPSERQTPESAPLGGSTKTHASTAPRPEPSPTAMPRPTPSDPWEPPPGEVYPNAKRLAARTVQSLTTFDRDTPVVQLVAGITKDSAKRRRLVRVVRPIHDDSRWSNSDIVYAQLGGVRPDSASVMVVAAITTGGDGQVARTVTRTMDVRLELVDGGWEFDELASVGGTPPDGSSEPDDRARAVLDDRRIELPDSARWDIRRGNLAPGLLDLMADIADRTDYGVTVVSSGHPTNVYGTDRRSGHTEGRAVDIHRLGQDRVVSLRDEPSAARRLVEWLYDQPDVTVIGSPWALDGVGGRSFTDDVHQDHIHISVD